MKRLFILLVLAFGFYQWYVKTPSALDVVLQVPVTATGGEQSGIRIIEGNGGPKFDVNMLAEPGRITIVEFYTEACPACKRVRKMYGTLLALRPDIAIRRVKWPNNWNVKWAERNYGVKANGTPHMVIFDAQGKVVAEDLGKSNDGRELFFDWYNAERRREWEEKRASAS